MRIFTQFSLVVLLTLGLLLTASAQDTKISVVKTTEHADGSIDIISKSFTDAAAAAAYTEEINDETAANVTIVVTTRANEQTDATRERDELAAFSHVQVSGNNKLSCDDSKSTYKYNYNYNYDYNYSNNNESKAFFGISPRSAENGGVLVTNITQGAGAQAAGILPADVIVAMAGEKIATHADFTKVLAQHQPGEKVAVTYLRQGVAQQTEVLLSKTSSRSYSYNEQRDPCQVFIGIRCSNTSYNERGVSVSSIIDDTPAQESRMLAGDLITAIDDLPVRSFYELLAERNKRNPGDYFTLDVVRNGERIQIDARFKVCDQPAVPEAPVAPAPPAPLVEAPPAPPAPPAPVMEAPTPPALDINSTLPVVDWRVYPNPTVSRVNVRFTAEAKPTTVQIVDATGKVIYRENINKFSGTYSREINLPDAVPGGVYLQVLQGKLIKTEKIVLLDRA